MIRAMLEAFEAGRRQELAVGLDPDGARAWSLDGEALLQRVAGWQARLRELGVRAGDRVALEVPRGPDLLPAHVAALASGLTLVPINPALSSEERARVLERADVGGVLEGELGQTSRHPVALVDRGAEVPALLIFTSGTTGEPKGVPHTEAGLEANLAGLASVWGLRPGERLLHVLPAHHVHGLVLALYGSARLGMPIVMLERFDTDLCLRALEQQRIDVWMAVPTMYHRVLESTVQASLANVRLCISGSAPLSNDDFARFRERFGHAPVERYGLTETLIVSSNPPDAPRPGVVGRALPETDVKLAPDGEILVRGPAVMPGYWQAPELAAETFVDGYFRTGDLGRFEDDGALVVSGRKKELIIVGGSNVLPGEVELALGADPDLDELAVCGLPDPDRGEVVCAFVVAASGADEARLEERLRGRAEERLAPYKRPRGYRFLSSLPRNAMGKIDRRALAAASEGPRP